MSPLRLAYLSLTRRKTTSLMALIAIAVSVACSGILLRLYLVSESRFASLASGGDVIIGAKSGSLDILLGAYNGEGDYPGFLPISLFESLRAQQNINFSGGVQVRANFVKHIIPFLYFGRVEGFRALGTDESFFKRPAGDGPRFAGGSIFTNDDEVVIGAEVARDRGVKAGDTLSVETWLPAASPSGLAKSYRVSGVLETTSSVWDRTIFASVASAQARLGEDALGARSIWGNKVLNYFVVYLEPGGYDGLSSLIDQRSVGQVVSIAKAKEKLEALTGTGKRLGVFMTVLILALGGLSVASMLITRFEAMSTQLAVLRAIGFKRQAIGRWLLWEGLLLGLTAVLIGGLLDAIGFPLMRLVLGDALPSPALVPSFIGQSAPVWICALAATVASVFIPLYRVYHQDVHFSLRN